VPEHTDLRSGVKLRREGADHEDSRASYGGEMLKLLLAAAVIAGVIVGAAHFSAAHHSSGPGPGGPTVLQVPVQNPLGGGQQGGGNDKIYVP
jgi:hypothetical protein